MSFVNNSYDPSSSLTQLQQLVNELTQSDKFPHPRNQDTGQSYIQSNDINTASASYGSSTWQMQPVTYNSVSPSLSESCAMTTNSQNNQTSLTNTTKKTPIWQTVAHMENLLFESDQDPSTNPTCSNCKPTSKVEKRKKRVICKCPNCSVKGGNKTYSVTGRLQHNCHIPGCGRNFDWPSILQTHLRTHADDRPFSCTWYSCRKKFKSKDELVRHIKTHTGERNFICPHCNLRFQRSDHLQKHISIIHENPKKKKPAKKKMRK